MTDVVADLQLGLKELGAEDRDGWGTAALSGRLGDLVGLHERTQVELLRTIALWDRRAAWGDDGAVTAVSWLKAQLDMAPGEAAAWVRLARVADEFPAILHALEGGEINLAKLRVLVRARAGREDPFAACVDGLVRLAGELPLADLTQVLAEWAELVDEGEDPGPERRRLNLGTTAGTGRGVIEGPAAACSRAATARPGGATPTTSTSGSTASPTTSTTASSCAAATTSWCTGGAGTSPGTRGRGSSPPAPPTAAGSPARPDHPVGPDRDHRVDIEVVDLR